MSETASSPPAPALPSNAPAPEAASAPTPHSIALVVHGHFYQPPRENPWTDEVPRETSAAPAHDWNERIDDECYRANAYARVFGVDDRIRQMVNNYAHLSFNFGPTLARWIERHDPRTHARFVAGDKAQVRGLGAGGALAQVWGHPIAPLLSPNDRRTQIHWGLYDFERRFGRAAEGIWLPETAADPATLEALIDAGIKYTILAPEQIAAVREPGGSWTSVNRDTVDTGRAYKWRHSDGSGRTIALCVFNGPFSRDLAFGTATRDAASFLSQIEHAATRSQVEGDRLVLAASDGELYGHHKKFADLSLAYALTIEAKARGIKATNLELFLRAQPPTWEAELAQGPHGEGTAWSCAHGVGRWRRHCGCAMRPEHESGWRQDWRGPLRDALDLLRDRAADFFEDHVAELLLDPWGARDLYGSVIDAPAEVRRKFLRDCGREPLAGNATGALDRAFTLMEMQRALLLMYSSCGWFFDDVAGLESALVIRQAAHAIHLWETLGGDPPTDDVLDLLSHARSNMPALGTGADVYRRVAGDRFLPAHAAAQGALTALFEGRERVTIVSVPGHRVSLEGHRQTDGERRKLSARARVEQVRTGIVQILDVVASDDGRGHVDCRVDGGRYGLADLPAEARSSLVLRRLGELLDTSPPSVETCRTALRLTAHGPPIDEAAPLFGRLLEAFLETLPSEGISDDLFVVVADLVERARRAEETSADRLAQDWLWECLSSASRRGAAIPMALRLLAERLRFSVDLDLRDGSAA